MEIHLYERLTRGVADDKHASMLLLCVEALLAAGNVREANAYLACAQPKIRGLPDSRLAALFHVRVAGLYYHHDSAVTTHHYAQSDERMQRIGIDDFVAFYLGFYRFSDGRMAFLHHAYLARWLMRGGHAQLAEAMLERMYGLYRQAIPMDGRARPFMRAAVEGEHVERRIASERAASCRTCEHMKLRHGVPTCSLMDAKVSASGFAATDLTTYAERLPDWGCKHPRRAEGRGWRR